MKRGDGNLPTLRGVLSRVHFLVTLFAVGITGLTVLVAGLATIGLYARQNLVLIAQTASYSVAPSIVFDDGEAARQSIAPLAAVDGVGAITVLTANGHTLAETRRFATVPDAVEAMTERLFFAVPTEAAVLHNGAIVGTVRVRGDAAMIARYIRAGIIGTIVCLLITAVATYLLAERLQMAIIAPLKAIASVAHAVRADRVFDRRAPAAGIEEIEVLRNDFNALLSELEEWRHHLRRENEALSHRATHDALTGLPNRARFEQALTRIIDRAARDATPFAVLYADADRFKSVNDRFGHAAGDAVLIEIATRLGACLRPNDIAARLGGDEFAVVLAAPCDRAEMLRLRRRVESSMAEPVRLPDGSLLAMTLSIGAAAYPDDSADVAGLINHADAGMYAAKHVRRTDETEVLQS